MTGLSGILAQLRRKNRSQYALLAGCCFFSTLLLTAYVLVMRSPTVLSVLPEGGDSRKQVMMVFALTVIGCGVFTAYASGLFFRSKSRESGVLLSLGATKAQLGSALRRELLLLAVCSCGLGVALGGPLAYGVWQLFRTFVVDTEQMPLRFDTRAYLLALAFTLYVLALLFWMQHAFLKRTNILDIIEESRRSEPVRDVPRWYGAAGILLVVFGVYLGYQAPGWFIFGLQWYPPEWLTAIFYLPAFVGLYWLLLHTVVNGWSRKNRWAHLVTTSIMRFQGRQTVRNLLVVTVLIAGAYFASFYAPILGVGAYQAFDERKVDYAFHYRNDQDMPSREEIAALAKQYGVTITRYEERPSAVLAYDGDLHVEQEGKLGVTYTVEYREELSSNRFLSESAWNALTGDTLALAPGEVVAVFDDSGSSGGRMGNEISLVTNPFTGKKLAVTPVEPVLCSTALFGCRVLDDADFAAMAEGLPVEWTETEALFDVADVSETYEFAKALFYEITRRCTPEVAVSDGWDPLKKLQHDAAGEAYFYDPENMGESFDVSQRDSSSFRLFWKYMPQFRVLDRADFVKTMAVYLMLFVFIAVICFAAVAVILFTRSVTIALTNRRVYDDLRHLGASNAYLRGTVRELLARAFFTPALTGTALISAFYTMILYFNDGGFSSGELSGMLACAALICAVSALLYGFYRFTLRRVCRLLAIG